MTTIVTAFFDIRRDTKGDGRTVGEYLEWIKNTLQLNCKLFVVTEPKFVSYFEENRPKEYPMVIKVIDFKDSYYYRYYDSLKEILESSDYLMRIKDPNRVECRLPEYNIIQYSKFHYLQMAIEANPFQSEQFLWVDAGISRFFLDVNITRNYPDEFGERSLRLNKDKFIIQRRIDLFAYPIDDEFIWRSDNLLIGTMFGGSAYIINKIAELVENVFVEQMLNKGNANNEQLALALVWNSHKELFALIDNFTDNHLVMFKLLTNP